MGGNALLIRLINTGVFLYVVEPEERAVFRCVDLALLMTMSTTSIADDVAKDDIHP